MALFYLPLFSVRDMQRATKTSTEICSVLVILIV